MFSLHHNKQKIKEKETKKHFTDYYVINKPKLVKFSWNVVLKIIKNRK